MCPERKILIATCFRGKFNNEERKDSQSDATVEMAAQIPGTIARGFMDHTLAFRFTQALNS